MAPVNLCPYYNEHTILYYVPRNGFPCSFMNKKVGSNAIKEKPVIDGEWL